MERYKKNMEALNREESESLQKHKVCIVGCGGLGGYIIESLGRLGIGYLTVVDGDVFVESNLNRQLLSDVHSIGKSKSLMARKRMQEVNPTIEVRPVNEFVDHGNAIPILQGHDVIVDALDSKHSRLLIQDYAEQLNIPLVHGAIGGWYGQVTTIFPGDKTLNIIYPQHQVKGLEKRLGNLPYTASLVASIQASQVIKILIGRGELLRKKLLYIDLLNLEFRTIPLGV
ncbi:MAG: HesA/MoeB/ThiF family protein [Syntrophomonadaceae bacterium]|jgi:molybdopterin/thiamine biosynthesis adenylyltransferase